MKNSILFTAFICLAFGLVMTSCGPGKKLIASMDRVEMLQKDSLNTHLQLKACEEDIFEYQVRLNNLQEQKASLQNENTSVHKDLSKLSSESKMTIAEQQEQLNKFQNIVRLQKNAMSKLKNSISDALMNYKTDELYVYIKDGDVYVSLAEKLLFKSGSDIVDPKGKEALKTLANVLNSTKDITVMVEGHTDNVPIKTALFEDNWDLSTARATSILRILTTDYNVDSSRITASGKGEFHPIKSNETDEGRAANRRTEIILSPNMQELYKLLDQ